ncbi:MAG: hypothetical protein V4576_00180 [Patescibacteria group bacterium]
MKFTPTQKLTISSGSATGILIVVLAVLAVSGFIFFKQSGSPSSEQIQPELEAFILENGKKDCAGTFEIIHLSDVAVGEYNNELKAWPIYAASKTSCEKVNSSGVKITNTYDDMDSPAKKTAVAFARESGNTYEVFIPKEVRDISNELNDKLKNASDKGFEEFKKNFK